MNVIRRYEIRVDISKQKIAQIVINTDGVDAVIGRKSTSLKEEITKSACILKS